MSSSSSSFSSSSGQGAAGAGTGVLNGLTQTKVNVALDSLRPGLAVRAISEEGVKALKESIKSKNFLSTGQSILVWQDAAAKAEGCYIVIDGLHRLHALQELNSDPETHGKYDIIPVTLLGLNDLPEAERAKRVAAIAVTSNQVAQTTVKSTLYDTIMGKRLLYKQVSENFANEPFTTIAAGHFYFADQKHETEKAQFNSFRKLTAVELDMIKSDSNSGDPVISQKVLSETQRFGLDDRIRVPALRLYVKYSTDKAAGLKLHGQRLAKAICAQMQQLLDWLSMLEELLQGTSKTKKEIEQTIEQLTERILQGELLNLGLNDEQFTAELKNLTDQYTPAAEESTAETEIDEAAAAALVGMQSLEDQEMSGSGSGSSDRDREEAEPEQAEAEAEAEAEGEADAATVSVSEEMEIEILRTPAAEPRRSSRYATAMASVISSTKKQAAAEAESEPMRSTGTRSRSSAERQSRSPDPSVSDSHGQLQLKSPRKLPQSMRIASRASRKPRRLDKEQEESLRAKMHMVLRQRAKPVAFPDTPKDLISQCRHQDARESDSFAADASSVDFAKFNARVTLHAERHDLITSCAKGQRPHLIVADLEKLKLNVIDIDALLDGLFDLMHEDGSAVVIVHPPQLGQWIAAAHSSSLFLSGPFSITFDPSQLQWLHRQHQTESDPGLPLSLLAICLHKQEEHQRNARFPLAEQLIRAPALNVESEDQLAFYCASPNFGRTAKQMIQGGAALNGSVPRACVQCLAALEQEGRLSAGTGNDRELMKATAVAVCSADSPERHPDFWRPFIEYFTRRDDLVADLFGGSLSSGLAAVASGRRFVAAERSIPLLTSASVRLCEQFAEQPPAMAIVDSRKATPTSQYANAVYDPANLPSATEADHSSSTTSALIVSWACIDCGKMFSSIRSGPEQPPPKWCTELCRLSSICKYSLVRDPAADWIELGLSGVPGFAVSLAWSGQLNYTHNGKLVRFNDPKDPFRIFRFPAASLFMSEEQWVEHGTFPPDVLRLCFKAECRHYGGLVEVRESELDSFSVHAARDIRKEQCLVSIWGQLAWNAVNEQKFVNRFSHPSAPRDRLLEVDTPICAKTDDWLTKSHSYPAYQSTNLFLHMHDLSVVGRVNSSQGGGKLVHVCRSIGKQSKGEDPGLLAFEEDDDEYEQNKGRLEVLYSVRIDAEPNVVFDDHIIFDSQLSTFDWNHNMPISNGYLLRTIRRVRAGEELLADYEWQTVEERNRVAQAQELLAEARARARARALTLNQPHSRNKKRKPNKLEE